MNRETIMTMFATGQTSVQFAATSILCVSAARHTFIRPTVYRLLYAGTIDAYSESVALHFDVVLHMTVFCGTQLQTSDCCAPLHFRHNDNRNN